jgi:putative autoinducer-2 (AI-2) aldolase
MPDLDSLERGKKFHPDIPAATDSFFLKGSNSLDWGMKNRLARIFNPISRRSVMLATSRGPLRGSSALTSPSFPWWSMRMR